MKKITYDQFLENYNPVMDDNDNTMIAEFDNPNFAEANCVWTMMNDDSIVSGKRTINAIDYVITNVAWEEDTIVLPYGQYDDEDDAETLARMNEYDDDTDYSKDHLIFSAPPVKESEHLVMLGNGGVVDFRVEFNKEGITIFCLKMTGFEPVLTIERDDEKLDIFVHDDGLAESVVTLDPS